MMASAKTLRQGVYRRLGDYHSNLNKKWSYYPIYLEKVRLIDEQIQKIGKNKRIIDVGCGEGSLVKFYRDKGYNIRGIDVNYSSTYVDNGDILKMSYRDKSFDIVLCLDVLQYLDFKDQLKAIGELKRIAKNNGILIFSIPNPDHFASRVYHLLTGKKMPTDNKTFPVGDRPVREYVDILKEKFTIVMHKGIFPTNFLLSSYLITRFPDRFLWLFKIINKFAYREWCFMNFIVCSNRSS